MAAQRVTATLVKELNRIVINAQPALLSENMLESAINRPAWKAYYNPGTPAHRLAAELAYGIILNHPFADGNKRTAFLAANEYLRGAGVRPFIDADPQYAAGEIHAIGSAHSMVAQQNMTAEQLADVYAKALGVVGAFPLVISVKRSRNLSSPFLIRYSNSTIMAAHAARLARLFTPEYACRINAQIVHPARSQLVKPNELESALARPLHVSLYEPDRHATYLAATLSYGIINGHPFMDGNKRTGIVISSAMLWSVKDNNWHEFIAFFLANEYLRAQGLPGLLDEGKIGNVYQGLVDLADRHIAAASGKLDVQGLAHGPDSNRAK
ncbi:hypothetical protein NM688_g5775 [Phlebia brevispora]|uniref:Uncharacterized protein n=1 Tax=Phlebia brevispora TaxID=194682 RepID=A0ACC1SQ61_9APHY|nr:hypothetical protein NM688_g5775 [Phlebia brevispora]